MWRLLIAAGFLALATAAGAQLIGPIGGSGGIFSADGDVDMVGPATGPGGGGGSSPPVTLCSNGMDFSQACNSAYLGAI